MQKYLSKNGREILARPAGPADLPAMMEIWWQLMSEHEARDGGYWGLLPEPEARASYREYAEKMLAEEGHVHLVAEMEGQVVGFVHGRPLPRPPIFQTEKVGRVDEVAVRRDFRGLGVGRAMMQTLLAAFHEQGYAFCDLMVDSDNPAAQALYHALGFYPREFHLVKKL